MSGVSTITQKGQVAIPKAIRDQFGLKAFDKVRFHVEDGRIVAEPVPTIDSMLGVISTKKVLSKKVYKETVKKRILQKYIT